MAELTAKEVDDEVKICIMGPKQSGKNTFRKQFTKSNNHRICEFILNYGKFGIEKKILDVKMLKCNDVSKYLNFDIKKYDIVFIICDITTFNNDETIKWINDEINWIKEEWDWENGIINQKIIVFIANKIDLKIDGNSAVELKYNDNDGINSDVYDENMKQYCENEGIYYYEMSTRREYAMKGENKDYIFKAERIIRDIVSKYYIAMYPKTRKSSEGSCDSFGSIFYDILTIFISFADLITDLLMLYTYYINGWIPFFVLSIIIIVLAQLSYCVLFTRIYGPYNQYWYFNADKTSRCMYIYVFLIYCGIFGDII